MKIFNLRKNDIIILTIAAIFLGIFIAVQYSIIKPASGNSENNEVMAVEIEKIAKTNADLKNQVISLTKKYQSYKDAYENDSDLAAQIDNEISDLSVVNAQEPISGQGVVISIENGLSEPQMVDLINAIKNIGADAIGINSKRLGLYSSVSSTENSLAKVEVIGNASVLESALKRKGGVIELIRERGINISIQRSENIFLPAVVLPDFKYIKE